MALVYYPVPPGPFTTLDVSPTGVIPDGDTVTFTGDCVENGTTTVFGPVIQVSTDNGVTWAQVGNSPYSTTVTTADDNNRYRACCLFDVGGTQVVEYSDVVTIVVGAPDLTPTAGISPVGQTVEVGDPWSWSTLCFGGDPVVTSTFERSDDGMTTWTSSPAAGVATAADLANSPIFFRLTCTDADGDVSTAIAGMTVTAAANQPPVTVDDLDPDYCVDINRPAYIPVILNDSDVDGMIVSVQIIDPSTGNPTTSYTDVNGHQWSVVSDSQTFYVRCFPASGTTSGTLTTDYVVFDDDGAMSNQSTVAVTVDNVDAPYQLNPNPAIGDAGQTVTLRPGDVSFFDGDYNPYSLHLGISSPTGSNPPNREVVVPGEGTWYSEVGIGIVTFTPEPDFCGVASTPYRAGSCMGNYGGSNGRLYATIRDNCPPSKVGTIFETRYTNPGSFTAAQVAQIDAGVAYMESVFLKTLSTETNPWVGGTTDKVHINITAGAGSAQLGSAVVDSYRTEPGKARQPLEGTITLFPAGFATSPVPTAKIMIHEMFHIMATIGNTTRFRYINPNQINGFTGQPFEYWDGESANAAMQAVGGPLSPVPYINLGGFHLSNNNLTGELNTSANGSNFSRISIGMLEDCGYCVDYSVAEPYTYPAPVSGAHPVPPADWVE